MSIIYHNGKFKDDGAVFAADDRVRLGEAVFDVMPVVDGRPCYVVRHMEKVLRAGDVFFGNWDRPGIDVLEQAACDLLEKNGFVAGRHSIRTLITRGPAGDGLKVPEEPALQVTMRAAVVPSEFPPIHAVIARGVARNEHSPLSQIKCANYGENILALREAEEQGASDAIMLNNAGHVACATTSNIFIVRGGRLLTPPLSDGTQDGLTRRLVMEQYDVEEAHLTPDDLRACDGIYFTNSGRGATVVSTLDGNPLPIPVLEINNDIHLE